MTDTPKDSPQPEPGRSLPPARKGRENPTVPPRALSGGGAGGFAAETPKPAVPPASVPPAAIPATALPLTAAPLTDAAVPAPPASSEPVRPTAAPPATPPLAAAAPAATSSGPAAGGATASAAAGPAATTPKPAASGPPAGASLPPRTPTPPPPIPPQPVPPRASPAAAAAAAPAGRRSMERWALPAAGLATLLSLAALGLVLSRGPAEPGVPPARVEALEQRLAQLQPLAQRVDQLQPLVGRLASSEASLTELRQGLQAQQEALKAQQAAAQAQQGEAGQALQALRAQVESQGSDREALARAADARIAEAQTALTQRIAGAEEQLGQRVAAAEAALNPRFAAVETAMQGRIAAAEEAARGRMAERDRALDARFTAVEQRETRLAAAERRLSGLVASSATAIALDAGKPLGQALAGLPGEAPAALSRYAGTAPPTEASLRLSFEEAARAARAKAEPVTEGQGLLEAAATRLGNLVTVRRGETVVWGDAVSGEIEIARRALEAGDLPAAVQRVEGLPEPVRAAMASWLEQAKGLIAARGALDALRSGGQG